MSTTKYKDVRDDGEWVVWRNVEGWERKGETTKKPKLTSPFFLLVFLFLFLFAL
jgi:hypothetical protein